MISNYYEIFKALHIISVICWMAGLFYLPRLYVYHADVKVGSETDALLQIMEKRLLRIIINPAMISSIIFGLLVTYIYGFKAVGLWFHLKMYAVIGMIGMHGFLSNCRGDFEKGKNKRTSKFFRILNEVPVVLMIICVMMVVLKPFEDL
jgi:putative membrane protein